MSFAISPGPVYSVGNSLLDKITFITLTHSTRMTSSEPKHLCDVACYPYLTYYLQ